MSLCRSDDGHPATQETVHVEVEIRNKNHKGDLISRQVFAFKRCHMTVHRPVVHVDGNLIPSSENILILHGNGKFTEGEGYGRPKTD
jgi:hypothetical protein